MTTNQLRVDKISLDVNEVSIDWNDGHRSVYGNKELRINCACAECVEEWTRRKLLDPAVVPADIRAEDHLIVGKYAVQFLWSDAHYTGIYPFEMLRDLCTCEECQATAKPTQ